jgi:predicted  nucleic acid-binding Zn-ribbon protein
MKKKMIIVTVICLFVLLSGTTDKKEVTALEDKIDRLERKIDAMEDKLDEIDYDLERYASEIIDRIEDL